MATVARPTKSPRKRPRVGPTDAGRRMSLDDFARADFEEGWFYELARGIVVVTEVPAPNHGKLVRQLRRLFDRYDDVHPGLITYAAGGMECRLRFPGMQSDRHPDQAVYLTPQPDVGDAWTVWIPDIVVEILSPGSKERDLIEKREEYLRGGVREYWVLDPDKRKMLVLTRAGDVWNEKIVGPRGVYRPRLLPGLEVRPAELFGPAK